MISWIVITIICYVCAHFRSNDETMLKAAGRLETLYTIFIVPVCTFSFFRAFQNIRIRHNNCINMIASTTFGVYLCHANSFNSTIVYCNWLKIDTFQYHSNMFPVYFILSVTLIFSVCSLIDYAGKKWFYPLLKSKAKYFINTRVQTFLVIK